MHADLPEQNPNKKPQPRPSGLNRYRNRPVHIPEGYLAVGLVIGAHGIRGEVKIESHTDFPERFKPGATLLA